ncbi:MAG: hypothetical protein ACYCT7_11060 [bacterium]
MKNIKMNVSGDILTIKEGKKKFIILLFICCFFAGSTVSYGYQFNKKTNELTTYVFGRTTKFLLTPVSYKIKDGDITVFAVNTRSKASYFVFYGYKKAKILRNIIVYKNHTVVMKDKKIVQKISNFKYSDITLPPTKNINPTKFINKPIINKYMESFGFTSGGLFYMLYIYKQNGIDKISYVPIVNGKLKINEGRNILIIRKFEVKHTNRYYLLIGGRKTGKTLICSQYTNCFVTK